MNNRSLLVGLVGVIAFMLVSNFYTTMNRPSKMFDNAQRTSINNDVPERPDALLLLLRSSAVSANIVGTTGSTNNASIPNAVPIVNSVAASSTVAGNSADTTDSKYTKQVQEQEQQLELASKDGHDKEDGPDKEEVKIPVLVCPSGKQKEEVCCASQCQTCGGDGCGNWYDKSKNQCCLSVIRRRYRGKSCGPGVEPPCIMRPKEYRQKIDVTKKESNIEVAEAETTKVEEVTKKEATIEVPPNNKEPLHHNLDLTAEISKKEEGVSVQLPKWGPKCNQSEDYIDQYCGQHHLRCQKHKFGMTEIKETVDQSEDCKTLWIAGMREGPDSCKTDGTGYQNMYGAALNSAIINAGDSLQPVLILGRLDLETFANDKLSKFGAWAKEKGAVVITVPGGLSFQDSVDVHYNNIDANHRQGPWLRLEIPRLIEENGLFDMPNVCKRYALYTDSDVIFANKISRADIKQLTNELSTAKAIVSYGREFSKVSSTANTGIMLIDVQKFGDIVPGMIKFLEEKGPFGAFDQGLVNAYFTEKKLKRHVLNIYYNWKAYWKVEPSNFDQVKIVHLHGPTPGRGLEAIASCNAASNSIKPYDHLVKEGICCDKGRTASWALNSLHDLTPASEVICEK